MTSDRASDPTTRVALYATLRPIAGGKFIEVPAPDGATLRAILEAVLLRYPPMRPELMDENGELYRHVHLFLNGRDAHHLAEGLDTPLPPGATLDLFPAVGGG